MKYYKKRVQSYSLEVHFRVEQDLKSIRSQNEEAWADLLVFLEEAKDNQETLEKFTCNGYATYENCQFDVKEIQSLKKQKCNIWRLKYVAIESGTAQYRIIYAFDPQEYKYYVLAVIEREFNYDFINHPRGKQIIEDYNELGLVMY